MRFKNRIEAGQKLARLLDNYRGKDIVVYGLPRGGVVTANEVARYLSAPLELILVRKITHPFSPEYAIGAVTQNGQGVFNPDETEKHDRRWLMKEVKKQRNEIVQRRSVYCGKRKPVTGLNKTAILVDDGIATGLTVSAAVLELKHSRPHKIIIAVPVCPSEFEVEALREGCELIALIKEADYMGAVSMYYEEFPQVSDDEVIYIVNKQYSARKTLK